LKEPLFREKQESRKVSYLKTAGYFAVVAVILVVIVLGSYFALAFATGESDPFTIVTGPSMQPTILPGSIAIISKTPFNQLTVGEVIVFQPQLAIMSGACSSTSGGSLSEDAAIPCYVIHRIVKIETDQSGNRIITTTGDDNNGQVIANIDDNIGASAYVGQVILQLPYIGYLTVSPYNEYAAGVILLALILDFAWDRKKPEEKSTPKVLPDVTSETSD
jgi:signal peptidase I